MNPWAEIRAPRGLVSLVLVAVAMAVAVANSGNTSAAQEAAASASRGFAPGDWPQWRGHGRDGKAPDHGLLSSWPEGGPELVWSTSGAGVGFSSLSIAGDRIFTMGDVGGRQHVMAFGRDDGALLWRTEIGPAWTDEYGGPRSTPTLDGNTAYALGTNGDLAALDIADGAIRWQLNLRDDLGGEFPRSRDNYTWRYAESPLVDGERLVVTPGGSEALMVALDKESGDVSWRSTATSFGDNGTDGGAYSSVVVTEAGGVRQYVQLVGRGVIGVEAESGRFLWGYDRMANDVANIPTPLVIDDYVLSATGYGAGAALLQLQPEGNGIRATEVWFNDSSTMQNHHGGMVAVDGTVFLGQGHNRGFPQAVDLVSGEVLWGPIRNAGSGSAAVMYADGHLYYRYQNGLMVLVEASRDEYREKGSFMIPNPARFSWAHPVIAGGRLYLREQDAIHVYDISG